MSVDLDVCFELGLSDFGRCLLIVDVGSAFVPVNAVALARECVQWDACAV